MLQPLSLDVWSLDITYEFSCEWRGLVHLYTHIPPSSSNFYCPQLLVIVSVWNIIFWFKTMDSIFQCPTFKAEDIFTSSFPLPIHPFYFPTPVTILMTFPLLSVTIIILCLVYSHISQIQLHIRVTWDCWKILMPKSDPQSSDLIHLKEFSIVTIQAPQRFQFAAKIEKHCLEGDSIS